MDYLKIAAKVLDKLNPDYYDIRYGQGRFNSLSTEKSKIKRLNSGVVDVISIRVINKGAQSFCSTTELDKASLVNLANKAFKLSKTLQGQKYGAVDMGTLPSKKLSAKAVGKKLPDAMSLEEKIAKVTEYAKYGTKIDKKIKNADIFYSDVIGTKYFLNSEGTEGTNTIQRVKLASLITSKQGSKIEAVSESKGKVAGLEYVFNNDVYKMIDKTAEQSIALLYAKRPKSGTYSLALDPEIAGTLAHEAIGHATEGDTIAINESVLCGRIGQKLAPEFINLSDDPALKEYGYVGIDDEGVKPRKHKLIVNGILNEYLLDRISASKLNMKTNGAARAASINQIPLVRMSNTFFEAGNLTKEEVFEQVKDGYLLVGLVAGTTNPITGTFNFTSKCTYRIEKGELKEIMLPIVISGDILTTLNNLTGAGKEVLLDAGYCSKEGQELPASSGGPFMAMKNGQVGGA